LVAQSWGRQNIQQDDEIVITWLEHHANIVPWQMLCAEKGARLRVAPVDDSGQVLLDEYEKLLGPKTRLVSISHVSNALGTVVPVKETRYRPGRGVTEQTGDMGNTSHREQGRVEVGDALENERSGGRASAVRGGVRERRVDDGGVVSPLRDSAQERLRDGGALAAGGRRGAEGPEPGAAGSSQPDASRGGSRGNWRCGART
jgi:hypothetical protein